MFDAYNFFKTFCVGFGDTDLYLSKFRVEIQHIVHAIVS